MTTYQTFSLNWQGIELTIRYQPDYSATHKEVAGFALAHITVQAAEPLPITQTGFRSQFLPAQEVVEAGGVIAYVQNWLAVMAQSPNWKQFFCEKRQLKLF